jgi:hypothetical protein
VDLYLAIGAVVPEDGTHKHVKHEWLLLGNGDEPVDWSCGSAIMGSDGKFIGNFRYEEANPSHCLAASTRVLGKYGWDLRRADFLNLRISRKSQLWH